MNQVEAAESGNLQWFKDQKAAGTLPELRSSDIRFATASGHLEVIKWLVLESGQPVNVAIADNYAIGLAAEFGRIEVIKWLVLESGQPVDVTAADNWAVGSAAANGYLEVVKWLVLESGQPVDVMAADGSYALGLAVENGHLEVVGFLNAVIGLHNVGMTIQQLQAAPAMVSLVESGKLDPKIAKELSTEDLNELNDTTRSRKRSKLL